MSSQNNLLYILPKSLYSCVGVLLLWEKGVQDQYKLTPVDLEGSEHNRPDFIRINSAGKVPVLVHQGQVIPDSLAIAQFLDGKQGPLHAYDDEVVSFVDEWRQVSIKALKVAEQSDEDSQAERDAHAKVIAATRDELVRWQEQHPDLDYAQRLQYYDARAQWLLNPDVYRQHERSWNAVLDHSEYALANAGNDAAYLLGDQHTLVDIYATSFIFSALLHLKYPDTVFANRPHLKKYYERQSTRPAVINALFK